MVGVDAHDSAVALGVDVMWASIAAALAALIPELVKIWGPPSAEDMAALRKACEPLPAPGPADKVLAEIEKDVQP